MAEIPDLTFKMGNKPSTTAKLSSAADATPSNILRFPTSANIGGSTSPTVKLTQTVPIHILRVEDKSSGSAHHQQLTDSHGRPMGVAAPVPVLVQPGSLGGGGGGGNTSGNVNSGSSSNAGGASTTRKKTGSSFQITSVTDGSRLSNDGGDDSADDLDESHTDDLSSELGVDMSKTDYDYSSEDAFSSIKDDPASLLNQYPTQQHLQQQQQQQQQSSVSSTIGTAPRISVFTTTQSDSNVANATTVESTATNVSVTVVESPATVPMSVVQNPDIQWQNRFRVVKIESSEPFRRGRWLCMDFLDPPPPTSSHCEVGDKDSSAVSGGGNGSGNSSGTNSFQHGDSLVIEHGVATGSQAIVTSSWSIEPSVQSGAVGGVIGTAIADKGPLISNVGVNCDHYPVSIILQTQQQGNLDFTNTALHMQGRTPQFLHQGYNLAASNPSNSEYIYTSNVPTITTAQEYQQQPPQQSVSSQVTGLHQVSTTNSAPPTEFVSGGMSPAPQSQQPTLVYPTPAAPNSDYSQQQQQQAQSVTAQPISSQIVSASATVITNQQQQQQPPSQCYMQQVAPGAGNVTTNVTVSVPDSNQAAESGTTPSSGVSVGAAANTTPVPPTIIQQGTNTVGGGGGGAPPAAVTGGGSVVSPSQETADGSQQVVQQSGEEGEAESLKALAAFLGEGHKLPGRSVSPIDDGAVVTSAKYSSSGASTVAIDNKIEQAMDLVKSHLMFAVREEVDVLKEKITELMERINQLEFENTILKAAASPETLAMLANSQTPNPPST